MKHSEVKIIGFRGWTRPTTERGIGWTAGISAGSVVWISFLWKLLWKMNSSRRGLLMVCIKILWPEGF